MFFLQPSSPPPSCWVCTSRGAQPSSPHPAVCSSQAAPILPHRGKERAGGAGQDPSSKPAAAPHWDGGGAKGVAEHRQLQDLSPSLSASPLPPRFLLAPGSQSCGFDPLCPRTGHSGQPPAIPPARQTSEWLCWHPVCKPRPHPRATRQAWGTSWGRGCFGEGAPGGAGPTLLPANLLRAGERPGVPGPRAT